MGEQGFAGCYSCQEDSASHLWAFLVVVHVLFSSSLVLPIFIRLPDVQ